MPITSETAKSLNERKKEIRETIIRKKTNQTSNATSAAIYQRKSEELLERSRQLDERESILKIKYDNLFTELERKKNELELQEQVLNEKARLLEIKAVELAQKSEELLRKEEDLVADVQVASMNNIVKGRRKRCSKKILKPFKLLSRKQKYRRRQQAQRFGVPLSLSTEDSLKLLIEGRFTQKQRRAVNRLSPKFFASEHSTEKQIKNMLGDLGWDFAVEVLIDGEKVKVLSFARVLLWRLKNIGIYKLPEVIQVTFGGDSGDGTFKLGFYLNNLDGSQCDGNFVILATFKGSENYENIKKVVDAALRELDMLSDCGLLFEYFLVGDLKFLSICLGLQGCAATYFCIWCLAKKSSPMENTDELRWLDDLLKHGDTAKTKAEEFGFETAKFKNFCRLENKSVCRPPIFTFIPLTHVVPPVMHIITGSVNYVLKLNVNKEISAKILKDCKINVQFPSHDLTGGDVSKLLQYLCTTTESYMLYGIEVLRLMNGIKSYAKCRDYSTREIDELEFLIEQLKNISCTTFNEIFPSQKFHDLFFHVLPFFRLHSSWGRFTEQSLERSHQKMKILAKKLKKGNKLEYALKQSILETAPFDFNACC